MKVVVFIREFYEVLFSCQSNCLDEAGDLVDREGNEFVRFAADSTPEFSRGIVLDTDLLGLVDDLGANGGAAPANAFSLLTATGNEQLFQQFSQGRYPRWSKFAGQEVELV